MTLASEVEIQSSKIVRFSILTYCTTLPQPSFKKSKTLDIRITTDFTFTQYNANYSDSNYFDLKYNYLDLKYDEAYKKLV